MNGIPAAFFSRETDATDLRTIIPACTGGPMMI